ncbi:hypothetical protein DRP04_00765 [Archaeoglobales archaeon]|nr:MAG: hypothetical protein DRP04_00765 [Archaeoglobales archaeon]
MENNYQKLKEIIKELESKVARLEKKVNQLLLLSNRNKREDFEPDKSTNILRLGRNGKWYAKFIITAEELAELFNELPGVFDRAYLITLLARRGHGRAGLKSSYIIHFLASKGLIKIITMHPLKCKKLKDKISIDDIV